MAALPVCGALAEPLPVAQIRTVTPAIRQGSTVLRENGRTDHTVPGLPLYSGDVVRIAPCEPSLGIVIGDMDHESVQLPRMGCEYRVERLPPMGLFGKARDIFESLFNHAAPDRPIPNYSLGGPSDSTSQDRMVSATPGVPQQDVLLRRRALLHQAGLQNLTSSVRRLFVLWNPLAPPPYRLTLTQGSKASATVDVPVDIDAVLPLEVALKPGQPATMTMTAAADGTIIDEVAIAVVAPEEEPRPPAITPADLKDPELATALGLWLLANGGPAWRLQAMAHLQESVATHQDFLAARVLRALVAGEWVPPAD